MQTDYIKINKLDLNNTVFRLSRQADAVPLAISHLKYDVNSWFHKERLMTFDARKKGGGVRPLVYHPSATDLSEWLDTGTHVAVNFVVFIAQVGILSARTRIGQLTQNRTALEKAADGVKAVYRTGSGIDNLTEGGKILIEHIKYVTHPGVFEKEGYYDDEHKLRIPGSIQKSDVFYGDIP